jgi:hypothetical protein
LSELFEKPAVLLEGSIVLLYASVSIFKGTILPLNLRAYERSPESARS